MPWREAALLETVVGQGPYGCKHPKVIISGVWWRLLHLWFIFIRAAIKAVLLSLPIQLDKLQGQPNKPLCMLCGAFALFKYGYGLELSISECAPASSQRGQ